MKTKDLTISRHPESELVLGLLFILLPIFRIRWDVVAGGNIWPYFLIFSAAVSYMADILNPLGGQGGVKPVNYRLCSRNVGEATWTGGPKSGCSCYNNRLFRSAKLWEVK